MSSSQTSLTLLEKLGNLGDEVAWQRFDDDYRPMVKRFARRMGLEEHDADDAAQRTLLAFQRRFADGGYDREKGRLKNWLLGMARYEIADLCAERARQPIPASQRSSIEAALNMLRDPESISACWEQEWQNHVVRECFARIKTRFNSRDAKIFEMLTMDEQDPGDVAKAIGVSPQVVRQVKYKILRYMRGVRNELEAVG